MIPLIDCDILRYEIGSGETYRLKDDKGVPYGDLIHADFRSTCERLDNKVEEICSLVWATEEPIMFLSMDARTKRRQAKRIDKKIKRLSDKCVVVESTDELIEISAEIVELEAKKVYKPNFREGVAKKQVYKGNRKKSVKPDCYDRLTDYILAKYNCVMAEGLEADDLLSIHQRAAEPDTTIICSRDKDLRITPGMHFGWECGRQAQFGPEMVTELGRLKFIYKGKLKRTGAPKLVDIKGTGLLFFCLQLIKGDSTDNIVGVPGKGLKCVKETLAGVDSYEEALCRVRDLYIEAFGGYWGVEMLEQARLLWMVAELDEKGKPVMFELLEFLYE